MRPTAGGPTGLRHVDEELFPSGDTTQRSSTTTNPRRAPFSCGSKALLDFAGAQVLPVSLNQTVANLEVRSFTNLHDADDGLMAGRHGFWW